MIVSADQWKEIQSVIHDCKLIGDIYNVVSRPKEGDSLVTISGYFITRLGLIDAEVDVKPEKVIIKLPESGKIIPINSMKWLDYLNKPIWVAGGGLTFDIDKAVILEMYLTISKILTLATEDRLPTWDEIYEQVEARNSRAE